jgi:uncharacterized protein with HEPN domain
MRRDEALLLDMLIACQKIERFTVNLTQKEFDKSEIVQSATLREIQVIGEAARMVSDEMKSKQEQIPWHIISGMRNRIIHEYFDVDLKIVWQTIQTNIPDLREQLREIVSADDE